MPTTQAAPTLVQSFRDSNGNPLAGGQLYTYAAGTSTPQTTYIDATGVTANANPVVLNSRGEANVWLAAGQNYKFALYDAFSTLIYTVDQVTVGGSSGVPVTLASAATVDIGGQGSSAIEISGSTAITSFGANYNGPRFLRFTGAMVLTQSATLNLIGGVNITTAAGDSAIAYPNAALNGWNITSYQQNVSLTGNSSISTLSALSSINGGQVSGLRNRILNGGMLVDQRNGYAQIPLPLNNAIRMADMHLVSVNGASTVVQVVSTTALGAGIANAMQISGAAGVTNPSFFTRIASINSRDLAGKTASFSMSVYQTSGVTQTFTASVFRCNALDNFSALTLDTGITLSVSTVPSGVATIIKGTIALSASDTTGLQINANYAGALSTGVCLFGPVQFELGATSTAFEQRDYESELARCRYYLIRDLFAGSGTAGGGTVSAIAFAYPREMRIAPTLTVMNQGAANDGGSSYLTTAIALANSYRNSMYINITTTAFGAYHGVVMYGADLLLSAELN